MKKILIATFICAILLCSAFALTSCRDIKLDGTYRDAFGEVDIEFDGDEFVVYDVSDKNVSVSGTYKLAYDHDGEADKIKFYFSDESDVDIERFAFLKKDACDFDYDKESGRVVIEIADSDFKKQ